MADNETADVHELITFGQMALEQGWYDQAREYFEQALALDASNREAMKGLARVNEILSRREAIAAKPIQVAPVKSPRKVTTQRWMVYSLAALLVLAVIILVRMAYIVFIEPRREIAVAPTAPAISTETPKPPPTLKPLPTPTQKRPVPTPIELTREFIFRNLVNIQDRGVGDEEAYNEMAQGWGITVDTVKAIEAEGTAKGWLESTPVPPTPARPTATPIPPQSLSTRLPQSTAVLLPAPRVCCKICTTGKACGDSCISISKTCHKPPGCACNGW